ncbi:hypothetical protein FRC12_009918 [Ceratobasidium sp. 428]|nr:hypothetical protein FRC12_009918 [Ceratobasidium sp. 428]
MSVAARKYEADAYIVVVPKPSKGVLGFKRYADDDTGPDDRGQYMFWIKIGDSASPMDRLQKYLNPDQAHNRAPALSHNSLGLVHLTNCPSTKPGKDLERKHLRQVGVTDTEWHALYAADKDGAAKLCVALHDFLKKFPPNSNPAAGTFDDFSLIFGSLIDNRFQNNQVDGREVLIAPSRVYAIYVLVTPNTNTTNVGVATMIRSAETPHITSYALMAERFKTLMPSFSFNGFRVDTKQQMPAVVEMMQEKLRELLDFTMSEYGCQWEEYEDGWFVVEGEQMPTYLLDQFVDWFDEGPVDLLAYNREPNKFPLPERIWSKPGILKKMDKMEEDKKH